MLEIRPLESLSKQWMDKNSIPHLFYSWPWLKTIENTYGFTTQVLVNEQDEFQLAFSHIKDVKGSRIINLPFSDYAPSGAKEAEHYNHILKFLKEEYPQSTITLKTDLPEDTPIDADLSRQAVTHIIPLKDDPVNKSDTFQRNVHKARENGLKVNISHSFYSIDKFYTLYHRLRFHKFNSIPQPINLFKNIYDQFMKNKNGFFMEVMDKDRLIASAIILIHDQTVYYKFGCSDENHLDKRPNNLLFAELIKFARNNHYQKIDLGLSGTSDSYEGLRRWKKSMGGIPKPVTYWNYVPEAHDANKEEKVMKNLKKLTDAMIESNLNPKQTSAFSQKIYPLFA